MKILNCLSHSLTPDQITQLASHDVHALTIVNPELQASLAQCGDDVRILEKDVSRLIELAGEFDAVILPIGSPAFMFWLAFELGQYNTWPTRCRYYFAHSVRETEDRLQDDGSVVKVAVFRHIRFFNLKGESL